MIVDDDHLVRWSLRERLHAEGYAVAEAATGAEAKLEFEHGHDLVFLDHRLPDADGLSLLQELKHASPESLVIFLTAHGTVQTAVDAMSNGAFYFILKPFDVEQVVVLVARALETTRLEREVRALLANDAGKEVKGPLVGGAPAMLEVKALVQRFARSPSSTVLITGESGVGKDVAARALHAQSTRAGKPFVNITCTALAETLLESELFGHERGAFTDAKRRKTGLFEEADGGTVFLDEIGDMALGTQAKLLRFLEEKAFRRVGGSEDIRPDVRVVAATHRDLEADVRAGRFREDLFYRLAVLRIGIPPLRQRVEDIELLAKVFIDRFNRTFHKHVTGLEKRAVEQMRGYSWPGNVRELRNVIERAMLLCNGPLLTPDDVRLVSVDSGSGANADSRRYPELPIDGVDIEELISHLVKQALARTHGNKTRAAALLGMTRDQIRYRIDKITRSDGGDPDSETSETDAGKRSS